MVNQKLGLSWLGCGQQEYNNAHCKIMSVNQVLDVLYGQDVFFGVISSIDCKYN